jgi:hypothetical protein
MISIRYDHYKNILTFVISLTFNNNLQVSQCTHRKECLVPKDSSVLRWERDMSVILWGRRSVPTEVQFRFRREHFAVFVDSGTCNRKYWIRYWNNELSFSSRRIELSAILIEAGLTSVNNFNYANLLLGMTDPETVDRAVSCHSLASPSSGRFARDV